MPFIIENIISEVQYNRYDKLLSAGQTRESFLSKFKELFDYENKNQTDDFVKINIEQLHQNPDEVEVFYNIVMVFVK